MAKRTKRHGKGWAGHRAVQLMAESSKLWIARDLSHDYGVDIELEFSEYEEAVSGKFIKAQIKTLGTLKFKNGVKKVSLKKSFLRMVYECKIPFILITYSLENTQAWYVWLQKWLAETGNFQNIYDESKSKSLTVDICESHLLTSGLENELIQIANGNTGIQIKIAIKELARMSIWMHDNSLSNFLFDYLKKLKPASNANPIEDLIEDVLDLGDGLRGTGQGAKVSGELFKFIKQNGTQLTADHVAQMVIRGEVYSRTGIVALGLLYDEFPEHTQSLGLVKRFEKFVDPRPHYYCVIRERFIGIKSPEWFLDTANWSVINNDFQVGKIRPNFSDVDIWSKWANRGDAAFLDYLAFD